MNSTRTCAVAGCVTAAPRDQPICENHWPLVPASLRSSITESLRSGPTADSQHRALLAAAVAEISHKEARKRARRPSAPARKPIQLPLFDVGTG